MTTRRFRGFRGMAAAGLVAAASALVLLAGIASAADDPSEAEWDQTRTTEVAAALATALQQIVSDPSMSGGQRTTFQDRNLHGALVDLKQMSVTTNTLTQQLEAGRSPEQTRPVFQQIQLLRDGVRMYAENSEISPAVQAKAATAIEALDELSRLYAPY